MSTQEVTTHRAEDRVEFLTIKKDWGYTSGVQIGANEVSVICWIGCMADESPVCLTVRSNRGFDLAQSMTPAEARMVGNALLAAADEADKGDDLDDAIEANGGKTWL